MERFRFNLSSRKMRATFEQIASFDINGSSGTDNCQMNEPWLPSYFPDSEAGTPSTNCADRFIVTAPYNWEHADVEVGVGYSSSGNENTMVGSYNTSISGDCVVNLYTGGNDAIGNENIWSVSCPVTQYEIIDPSTSFESAVWTNFLMAYGDISVPDFGQLDSNYVAWATLANDTTVTITPNTGGSQKTTFNNMSAGKYTLVHQTVCTAPGNTNNNRTTIGIGEAVLLSGMPDSTTWSLSGNGTLSGLSGSSVLFTAKLTPGSATITAQAANASVSVTFTIIAPSGVKAAMETPYFPIGLLGPPNIYIGAEAKYILTVLHNTVSFANVEMRENLSAFYTTWPDGTNRLVMGARTVVFGGIGSCSRSFEDTISDGSETPFFYSWLNNGTNYIAFSYPYTWNDQYQDANSNWINFATLTVNTSYTSDGTCTETYQNIPSDAQGPYQSE